MTGQRKTELHKNGVLFSFSVLNPEACRGSSLPHGPCEHVVGNLPLVMDERNITSDDPNKGASEITK